MDTDSVFQSRFLKAEDFPGDVIVVVAKVEMEKFTDIKTKEVVEKPLIWFKDCDKALVCNKTNWEMLKRQLGVGSTDAWIGKSITIGVMDVQSFDDIVSAIRIKPSKATPKPGGKTFGTPAPASEQEAAESGADEEAGNARKHGKF
jgi:hypothetical protein